LYDIVYNRKAENSLTSVFDKSIHLVTRNKNFPTEKRNLNFIFTDEKIWNDFWNLYYEKTPYILLYLVEVATAIFEKYLDIDIEIAELNRYIRSLKIILAVSGEENIEILSNIPLSFTSIEFLVLYKMIDGKRMPLIKGKFFVQHSRKSQKWKSYSQQDISLRALEDSFEHILNHWFDKSEELEFIVRQFSKNLHGDLYLEDQLVDAIRNLEVYSRNFKNFKNPKCLSDVEEKARQSLFDFINTHLLEEVRRKFRNKLKFNQKEPNLAERLKNLFDSIDELNLSKIFSNSERELLIIKLIQTRNYYTHGDSKDNYPEMITDIREMYETKLLLQEVLRYYIYQELDMKYKYKKF
jgi:hypothetical protein